MFSSSCLRLPVIIYRDRHLQEIEPSDINRQHLSSSVQRLRAAADLQIRRAALGIIRSCLRSSAVSRLICSRQNSGGILNKVSVSRPGSARPALDDTLCPRCTIMGHPSILGGESAGAIGGVLHDHREVMWTAVYI